MPNWKSFFQDVLQHRFKAMVVSALFFAISLGGIAYQGGLVYGIDFTGGLQILLEFNKDLSTDRVNKIRNVFKGALSTSKVNTVSLKGESDRRGLMVTVRGQKLVNSLTERLYQAGRAGSQEAFRPVEGPTGESFVQEDVLRSEFTLGDQSEADRSQKIDITRASRSEIRSRVQTIVNSNLSGRVVDLLRNQLVDQSEGLDLNWASPDEIQSWMARYQNESFVDALVELRDDNSLSRQSLMNLLDQFGVPYEPFFDVFRFQGEDPDRLDLRELPASNLGNITYEEFFQGRYGDLAQKIVDRREKKGIFREKSRLFASSIFEGFPTDKLEQNSYLSPFVMKRREMISPSIGSDLIYMAALAILLSFVGILGYLYVRFELTYSFGAIGAIFHDVVITVGLITLFGIEFNVPVVAAILTVIGYSLNDTIVNFDRVRENRVLMGHDSEWYEVINRSVVDVLNRTVVTSLTTFIAAVILYIYGGIALSGFAATLIIGVVCGTYSSIYVSNLILYRLQRALE